MRNTKINKLIKRIAAKTFNLWMIQHNLDNIVDKINKRIEKNHTSLDCFNFKIVITETPNFKRSYRNLDAQLNIANIKDENFILSSYYIQGSNYIPFRTKRNIIKWANRVLFYK